MYLVIIIVSLAVILACLGMHDKKHMNESPPPDDCVDIVQRSYDEKLRKYKEDYDIMSPIIRVRF